MKKQILIITLLLLTSCANITFDARQYDTLITIKEQVDSIKPVCSNPALVSTKLTTISELIKHEQTYAQYRRSAEQLTSSLTSVYDIVNNMQTRFQSETPSEVYCTSKTDMISAGMIAIISTLGKM